MKKQPFFLTDMSDQREAVDKLIEESRADADYYLYLVLAGLIAAMGLHNDNPVVIIGAMLIAPALFPILSLGMGVVTSSRPAVMRALRVIGKSFAAVVIGSLILSFILTIDAEPTSSMLLASTPDLSSILIALFSGVIASYAWVKQSQSAMLPGVAIAVSLVPPLANIGIGIAVFSKQLFAGSLLMFILNIIGIFFGSLLVFAMFGFSNMRGWQDHRIKQEEKEKEAAATEKQASLDTEL